ncbi:MAG: hypothetical protein QGG36_18705 [Pirellulaceae bacterium]|nr:hypothetical protein [Pirellulaceae bacterium]MDP7017843.1 hypothetical protein [Pirellulaceae bacterium]
MPVIRVTTPSRLHFGLLSFGGGVRRFGGVGVMVDRPGLVVRFESAKWFAAIGPQSQRVAAFAVNWSRYHDRPPPPCRIDVEQSPPQHMGLGVGTQLGMAVAAGLNCLGELAPAAPLELAMSTGRGERSAVGVHGFALGGLIAERGKLVSERLSPLDFHVALPVQWRFILVRPNEGEGLSGGAERSAFGEVAAVSPDVHAELTRLLREEIAPAAARGEHEPFAQSVTEYGRLSGECFSPVQGGPYNGPLLNRLVAELQEAGGRGVGQSSWGPTLFICEPNQSSAERFVERFAESWRGPELHWTIAEPSISGANVEVVAP